MLTGLTPFTNYSVQVAAVNEGGTGPYSAPLTVETLQDTSVTSPAGISANLVCLLYKYVLLTITSSSSSKGLDAAGPAVGAVLVVLAIIIAVVIVIVVVVIR